MSSNSDTIDYDAPRSGECPLCKTPNEFDLVLHVRQKHLDPGNAEEAKLIVELLSQIQALKRRLDKVNE